MDEACHSMQYVGVAQASFTCNQSVTVCMGEIVLASLLFNMKQKWNCAGSCADYLEKLSQIQTPVFIFTRRNEEEMQLIR